jgi:hypothetical protein
MTKTELLEALRTTGDDVKARVAALDDATLASGRYENGWNARQILAHMASIEWTYPRLIDVAKAAANPQPAPAQPAPKPAAETPPSSAQAAPAGTPQILDYNERQVAKRAEASKQELIDEFAKNRAALIAAVEATDDALLAQQVTSAGGARGSLAEVIHFTAVQHTRVHLADLLGEGS